MDWKLLLIPIIGFFIGYITNYLVIVMLFHPKRKIFGIQGIIPKRKAVLAKKISEVTPDIMPPYFKKIEKIPIIGKMVIEEFKKAVETQVNSLSDKELELLIHKVFKNEMKFIVWLGGVIGLLIGFLQLLIVVYL
ncbi:DUF445 family protein [Candidatus Pacearchaeota archaeon]|nr:DUF445 family protein [Candidatus Pacearchaeota archaeon]